MTKYNTTNPNKKKTPEAVTSMTLGQEAWCMAYSVDHLEHHTVMLFGSSITDFPAQINYDR